MASEPIRDKNKAREMAEYYLKKANLRNYLLIILGIYTALRISDLLSLQWEHVYDFKLCTFKSHIYITEKKTGKKKVIALNKKAVTALNIYFTALNKKLGNVTGTDFLFVNNRQNKKAISRVQAWRIIKEAANAVNLGAHISCHSLRKTFGYLSWKAGAQSVVLMDIFNHSSYDVTRRYLGISQDDRDVVYLALNV